MARVVCFDVGGVLIRITHFWHEAAGHAGIVISDRVPPEASLLDAPPFDPYQGGSMGRVEYLDSLSEYLGITPREADRVHRHIMLEPHDGVEEIVAALNASGIVTACLSNTNELHWEDMNESGRFPANEHLKLRIASHILGLQKPDPAIFAKFEELSGATGQDIVFFDDTLVNLETAAHLGWRVFGVDPSIPTAGQIQNALVEIGLLSPEFSHVLPSSFASGEN